MTARARRPRPRWLWSIWPRLIASLLVALVLTALISPGAAPASGAPAVQPAAAALPLDPEPQPPPQPPETPGPGTQCTTNPDICQPSTPGAGEADDPNEALESGARGLACGLSIPIGPLVCAFDLLGGDEIADQVKQTIDFAADPFGYISASLMNGFTWLLSGLGELINKTTQVNFNNAGFIATYTQMFGLATIMTMFLWLLAVAKRVVAGIPVLEAAGESIGYLVLAVMVTAFMPGAVYLVHQLFEAACSALFASVPEDMKAVTEGVVKSWAVTAALGGGGVFMSMIGTFLLFAIVAVWVELVIRSALIYVSLAFGPLVFSGLVDKALWPKTKKWIGITLAIESSKLCTLTVLKLAIALLASTSDWSDNAADPFTAISVLLTALALFWLAFSAPMVIARFIPAFGDEIAAIAQARQKAHQFVRNGAAATPNPEEEGENGPPRSRLEQFGDGMARRAEQIEGWKDKLDDKPDAQDSADQSDDDPQNTSDADSPDHDSSGEDNQTGPDSTDGPESEAGREPDAAPDQPLDGAPGEGGAVDGAPVNGESADGAELGGADAATGGAAAAATGGVTAAADVADKAAEFGQKAAESGASRATGQDMSGSSDGGEEAEGGGPYEPDGPTPDLNPAGGNGADHADDKPVWWAGKEAGSGSPQADEPASAPSLGASEPPDNGGGLPEAKPTQEEGEDAEEPDRPQ